MKGGITRVEGIAQVLNIADLWPIRLEWSENK
jgi:hypothetical protein